MQHTTLARHLTPAALGAFAATLSILIVAALFPIFPDRFDIGVGDPAPRTVRSPKTFSYESRSETEQLREAAAAAVPPSLRFDSNVRTLQLSAYDRISAQIAQARALSDEERTRTALVNLGLSPRSIDTVLALTDEEWTAIVVEGRRVLDKALAGSMDEGGAAQARDGLDTRIAPAFSADQTLLTADIVRPLVTSTLVIDEELTAASRDAARASVLPKTDRINKGDEILTEGVGIDEVAMERLRAAGLLSHGLEWRFVAAVAIVAATAALALAAFLFVRQPPGITSTRHLAALAAVTLAPLVVGKAYIPLAFPDESRHLLAYILPAAAAPLLIAALLDTEVAVLVSVLTGMLMAFVSVMLPEVSVLASVSSLDSFRLLLLYGIAPLAGVFIIHRTDRLSRYLTAGIAIGALSYALLLATWFIDSDRQIQDLAWIALVASIGGVSAGVLAAGAFVTAGVLFGVTTPLQLMELSQLHSPLLRRLQDEAPGTFHHSVIVGNLAERAADLVGADPLLTRVGCYYHDIGKVLQPGMYIENQMGGERPHETMTPEESARVIQQHVLGGAELARRERLPARVQAFIPEHHGTRLVAYFYRKAAEHDPDVDPALFQYPGPRPQSKETAIVMLADSTEAVVRSSDDRSGERIDQLVEEVIAERVAEGQLDDSDLTLRDLRAIAESFKATMRAVYHPRVAYPEPTPMEARRKVRLLPLPGMPGNPAPPDDRPRRRRRL